MGNAQSDQGEQEAYNSWIKYIPVANVGYSLVRAVTYAAKGDHPETLNSSIGIGQGMMETIAWTAGPVGAVAGTALSLGANHASDRMVQSMKEENNRRG